MKKYKHTHFLVSDQGVVIGKSGKELSKRIDTKGYIRHSYKKKEFYVHQMVWDLYGDSPRNNLDINHKNGIKTDNRIENLECVTRSENIKHAYKLGLSKPNRNHLMPNCKIGDQEIIDIRQLFKQGLSVRKIARKYGVHHSIIFRIKCGKKKLTTEP